MQQASWFSITKQQAVEFPQVLASFFMTTRVMGAILCLNKLS